MSPSINSKWRSLTLADQAMGLQMAPKMNAQVTGAATTSAARADAGEAPRAHADVGVIADSAAAAVTSRPALGIAISPKMQWGVTRNLPGSLQERTDALKEIRARHDATCPLCSTIDTYTQTVPGEGSPVAELFFVGEAPGEQEDLSGRPFVGRAGMKLDEMIKAMGLSREQVFIANVLKSRPPNNRTPTPDEVAMCGPFLLEQLLVVRPRVIVTLGGPATKLILGVEEGITRLRGVWGNWNPPKGVQVPPIPVLPTFHPAYLLRNYTLETRGRVWSDLKMAMTKLSAQ